MVDKAGETKSEDDTLLGLLAEWNSLNFLVGQGEITYTEAIDQMIKCMRDEVVEASQEVLIGRTIYSVRFNIHTHQIKRHQYTDVHDYWDEPEYAAYNEDGFGCVYAESEVSMEKAETLVREKCRELADKFAKAVLALEGESLVQSDEEMIS